MTRLLVISLALLGAVSCDAYCREYGTCSDGNLGAGGAGGGVSAINSCGAGSGSTRGFENATPVEPAHTPPPITGGNMAAVGDGTWVVADADRSIIWRMSTSGAIAQVQLRDQDFPGRVLMANDGSKTAWVALRRANQLAKVDLVAQKMTLHATCTEPRGLAWRGNELLVGCATGTIEAFSPSGRRRVISETAQLLDLRDLEVVGSRVFVSTFRNAQVFELEEQGPRVLNNPVSVTSARGQDAVPRVAWRMRQGLLLAQNEQLSTLPPVRTPAGEVIACSNAYGSGGSPGGFGGAGGGSEQVTIKGPMSSVLYRIDGERLWPLAELTGAAVAVDMVETSQFVFVVSAGTNSLLRLDKVTHALTQTSLPGQPTSLESTDDVVTVFLREPAQLMQIDTHTQEVIKTMKVPLAIDAFSTGHDLFHRATAIHIACASCHPEAGDDGHVWPFAEGPRRTSSLRGGIKGTEPFHWNGEEPGMEALLSDVMSNRMSGPAQTPERTHALADWLDRQPALQAPPVNLLAVERGRILFDSSAVGCASCHTGHLGTNNADADVGTGGLFQVPRLTEAFWRTGLLHDGSLPNLAARVFPSRKSTLHGRIDQLSIDERLDLLEYLKTR